VDEVLITLPFCGASSFGGGRAGRLALEIGQIPLNVSRISLGEGAWMEGPMNGNALSFGIDTNAGQPTRARAVEPQLFPQAPLTSMAGDPYDALAIGQAFPKQVPDHPRVRGFERCGHQEDRTKVPAQLTLNGPSQLTQRPQHGALPSGNGMCLLRIHR